MRLENKSLGFVVNFLLGVAWASVLLGAFISALLVYQNSYFYILFSVIIGMIPGMVGVLFLEYFITLKETYSELQKQTKLLEKLI